MAAYTLICTDRNKRPIARQPVTAGADTVTVSARGMRMNRAKIQMVTTTASLLFASDAGGAVANGYPTAAGVPFTLYFKDGDTFEIAGSGAGFIDYLVVDE
jgi:hypothetical protein